MKKSLLSLIVGLSLAAPVCLAQSANEADVAAVKKVIIGETDAFFNRDQEGWEATWAHEPYISWTANGMPGQFLIQSGWDAFSGMFGGYFNQGPSTNPIPTFQRDNFQVTVLDKVATATFVQKQKRADGTESTNREVRVLEKRGADWKLVYVYSRAIE